jgi:hypothetical protein
MHPTKYAKVTVAKRNQRLGAITYRNILYNVKKRKKPNMKYHDPYKT